LPDQQQGIGQLAQKALAIRDPFTLIEDGHLKIKTKAATLESFILNRAQRRFLERIKVLWVENKIIRVNVLKARQLGISTLIEGVIFALTSYTDNTNSLIIADDLDGSNYIFEMSKLYQEQMPEHLLVKEKRSNQKKLEFADIHSQILIDTSQNPDAGRKYTFRNVHLSEYAFFDNANALMDGLSNSVPALPRTMIIKETTANGLNHFKEEWDAAEKGESDYVNIFIPWFWGDDYRMKTENFILSDLSFGEITSEERYLYDVMKKDGIDFIEERLQWRRWCIRNNCRGYVSIFKQEYPSNPQEAFVSAEKNILITPIMIDALRGLTISFPRLKKIVSIDPSLGGDECVMYYIENGEKKAEKVLNERDTMKIVGEVLIFMAQNKCDDVVVDCIGIGKGIADRLNEIPNKRVIYFNSSNSANKENDFVNLRSEAYFYVMEQIRDKKIAEIKDMELSRQLTTVPFKIVNSNGKILLMPKDWIKKKLGRSPDRADCFTMGLWALQYVDFWTPQRSKGNKDAYDVFEDTATHRNPMTA